MPRKPTAPPHRHTPPVTHEVVDPRWILSAFGIMVLIAAICAYATICALFYRGQWQLAMQPSRAVTQTPAAIHLPFTEVHFGVDASGQPQLDGWWIASENATAPTALVLHSGSGSMSDALPDAQLLHDSGLNVLLFDYRGFGRSGGQHPTETFVEEDAESALRYLTTTRGLPLSNIVVFGYRLGASPAVKLCADHPKIPALILLQPAGDLTEQVKQDSRSRMVPVGLLFHESFPIADRLHALATPKLILSYDDDKSPLNFRQVADPKMTVELHSESDISNLRQSMQRFLSDSGFPWLQTTIKQP
jgi:pimeloyl-ACP methyl ester carboxylesterase